MKIQRKKIISVFGTLRVQVKLMITTIVLLVISLTFSFAGSLNKLISVGLREHEIAEAAAFNSNFYVSFVDVGQGNCCFVKLPSGQTMLIDGGSAFYADTVIDFLRARGVNTIDFLVATHADADHIGTLAKVIETFEVREIYRPFQISGKGDSEQTFVPSEFEDLGGVYQYMLENLSVSNISRVTTETYENFLRASYSETYSSGGEQISAAVTVFYDGLTIEGEGYKIEFFAPELIEDIIDLHELSNTFGFATKGYSVTDSNNCSAIFLLTIDSFTFFFSGDASFTDLNGNENFEEIDFVSSLTEEERVLLSSVTVCLAGHHGSAFSTGEALLNLLSPQMVVISVGEFNTYGHPSPQTLARLSDQGIEQDSIFMTSKLGTITFSEQGDAVVFATGLSTKNQKYQISWELLSTILGVVLLSVIWNIKPKVQNH